MKHLGLELLRSEAAWDRRRRDRETTYDFARALGATHEEARRRADLAVERVQALGRIRVGTGRPKSSGPPEYHHAWAAKFVTMKAAMDERYAVFHVAGDPPPTGWEVALLVAHEDYGEAPQRWSYPPDANPRAAADRVWKAVKPLLNAQSKTRAA